MPQDFAAMATFVSSVSVHNILCPLQNLVINYPFGEIIFMIILIILPLGHIPSPKMIFWKFSKQALTPILRFAKLYCNFSNISNKYSVMEWENVPYLTCHVMYLLTQNVWPWQDLNLHRSRRDSNPQCLDPSSNALSYATRLLYRLSYTAGRDHMYKGTAWSKRLQLVLLPMVWKHRNERQGVILFLALRCNRLMFNVAKLGYFENISMDLLNKTFWSWQDSNLQSPGS